MPPICWFWGDFPSPRLSSQYPYQDPPPWPSRQQGASFCRLQSAGRVTYPPTSAGVPLGPRGAAGLTNHQAPALPRPRRPALLSLPRPFPWQPPLPPWTGLLPVSASDSLNSPPVPAFLWGPNHISYSLSPRACPVRLPSLLSCPRVAQRAAPLAQPSSSPGLAGLAGTSCSPSASFPNSCPSQALSSLRLPLCPHSSLVPAPTGNTEHGYGHLDLSVLAVPPTEGIWGHMKRGRALDKRGPPSRKVEVTIQGESTRVRGGQEGPQPEGGLRAAGPRLTASAKPPTWEQEAAGPLCPRCPSIHLQTPGALRPGHTHRPDALPPQPVGVQGTPRGREPNWARPLRARACPGWGAAAPGAPLPPVRPLEEPALQP